VRTPFGYHAIKVLDVEEGGQQPLKEVAGRIKDKLLAERSDKAARARAEEARPRLLGATDFAGEARRLGFELRETTIARGDGLEGIGRDDALEEQVFALAPGGVSTPVKTAGGYVVVKSLQSLPAGVPPLAEIKPQIVDALKRERAEALAMERARALAAPAKEGDLVALAKREGLTGGETPLFSRTEPPKGGPGLPGQVLVAALQTPAGQVADPVATPTAVYLVKALGREPADAKGFDTERGELARQVLEQKRSQAWEGWVKGLQASANIQISGQVPGRGR
jgi:peptidyl-prolyl cis-trans isomerase D